MSRFDIYSFVSDAKQELRPMLKGVFYEKGHRVATDAMVMLIQECEYPAEYEGKCVLKDGSFETNGKYPKYDYSNPAKGAYNKEFKAYEVDDSKFNEFIKNARESYKEKNGKGRKWDDKWIVKVGPCLFKARNMARFFIGRKEIKGGPMMVADWRTPAYSVNGNNTIVIMPMTVYGAESDVEVLEKQYGYTVLEF